MPCCRWLLAHFERFRHGRRRRCSSPVATECIPTAVDTSLSCAQHAADVNAETALGDCPHSPRIRAQSPDTVLAVVCDRSQPLPAWSGSRGLPMDQFYLATKGAIDRRAHSRVEQT